MVSGKAFIRYTATSTVKPPRRSVRSRKTSSTWNSTDCARVASRLALMDSSSLVLPPSRLPGLDFLADDGGLSAILGVVTVKLHADTIRDLISAKIEEAAIPPEHKSALKKGLASLSEKALGAATTDLVRTGLDHLPDAAHWLRQFLGL